MKISIVPNDNTIVIDGQGARVDLDALRAANVHAVQYDDAKGAIEVEYVKPANERIAQDAFDARFGSFVVLAQAALKAAAEAQAAAEAEDLKRRQDAERAAETATLTLDEINPDPALAHG